MDFVGWMLVCGALFLTMALAAAFLEKLPVSAAILYLTLGVVVGPVGLDLLSYDAVRDSSWFERLTELAVILSLFVGGLKLRLPLRDPAWQAAWWLAGPVMVLTIVGVAGFAHLVLGLPAGESVLLGALLAPTDPVLASEAAVEGPGDRDRLRYGLSGEAGLNDGTAFPFVVFGLLLMQHDDQLGAWVWPWALERLLWAVPAGLAIGFGVGWGVGTLATWLRTRGAASVGVGFNDFLALSVIAIAYSVTELAHGWGFLAAFASGLGMRRAEVRIMRRRPPPDLAALEADDPVGSEDESSRPAERVVERGFSEQAQRHPAVAAGTMLHDASTFGEALERLAEFIVVILLGIMVSARFAPEGLLLAAALFFVIRPVSVALGLLATPTTAVQRGIIAWLGIRGAGTVYYLAYAIGAGLGLEGPSEVTALALTTVAASIVVHGVTATPLLLWYQAHLDVAAPDD